MRRQIPAILAACTVGLAVAVLAAVLVVPPSASALPTFEFATNDGPFRLTPADLGAVPTPDGLQVDDAKLDAAVAALAAAVGTQATPSGYVLDPDHNVTMTPGTPGVELDAEAMKVMLVRALKGSRSNLELLTRVTDAPAGASHAIVVTLDEFRLDLYQDGELVQHYVVGVGALDFPTPPGAYYIRQKAANPTWRNPYSPWSRSMPAFIPPGPNNPLGTRALRLDRGALVIHGTPNPSSVGQRSSHGCIRMKREDVEALFELVTEQTPVFIIP